MTDLDPKIRTAFQSVRLDPSTRDALLAQAKPKASRRSAWGLALAIAATLLLVATPLTVSMDTVRAAFGLARTQEAPTVLSFDLNDLDGFLQAGDRAEVYAFADRNSGLIPIGEVSIRDRQGSEVWIECTEAQIKPLVGHQHLLRFAIIDGDKRRLGVSPDPIGTPDLGQAIETGTADIFRTQDGATTRVSEVAQITGESAGIVEVRVPPSQVVPLLLASKQGVLNLTAVRGSMTRTAP